MKENYAISVIVPFFNSKKDVLNCLETLKNQDIKEKIEIIFIDDCSSDETSSIIKKSNLINSKLVTLDKNLGPSAARNKGIIESSGEYIFFLDIDDSILRSTLSKLYNTASTGDYDLVFCDKKRVHNKINFRENIFAFDSNKEFNYEDITSEIKKRVTDPEYTVGVAGCHGKLIKKSIIERNNIFFEDKLRFLEDEIFIIDILGFSKKIKYLREQLYIYNINPDSPTGRSNAFNHNFPVSNFKIMREHIKNSLKNRRCDQNETMKYGDQALIYYLIYTLISYSLCIFRGKVDFKTGIKNRKKIINELINDEDIINASKNYVKSKNESFWIPKAIKYRSKKILEIACNIRTKDLLSKVRKK